MTLVTILGAVIALDHALAQIPEINSNSTGQLILSIIGSIGNAIIGIFSNKG